MTRPSSCRELREFLEAYFARVERVEAKVGGGEDIAPSAVQVAVIFWSKRGIENTYYTMLHEDRQKKEPKRRYAPALYTSLQSEQRVG